MANKPSSNLKVVDTAPSEDEIAVANASKNETAPMVQRLAAHRDRIDMAVKELESERFELLSRRDLVRRQAEAVEAGLTIHIEDIEATMRLYEAGLNSLAVPEG